MWIKTENGDLVNLNCVSGVWFDCEYDCTMACDGSRNVLVSHRDIVDEIWVAIKAGLKYMEV